MDQLITQSNHLGMLNEIHRDLIIDNLNFLRHIHPKLWNKPVAIFVEANLTQDLPAYLEHQVKDYFKRAALPLPKFVRQHDKEGKLMPGVLTQHKENLVSYFKRILDEEKLFVADRLSSVAKVVMQKYDSPGSFLNIKPSLGDCEETLQILIEQLKSFQCYSRGKSVIYSGKKSGFDDMVMALIIAVAWSRLPQNHYILK